MDNELMAQQADDGCLIPAVNDPYGMDVFNDVAKSAGWLPRLQLFGSGSDAVKEEKVPVGYALVKGKDMYEVLGREIPVLVIAWRPKALDLKKPIVDKDGKHLTVVVTSYDHKSEEFRRIKAKAAIKNNNALCGPEFLVWLPDAECFATFLMGSPTAQNEAPKVLTFMRKQCRLTTHLFSSPQYKWHGTLALPCSTPFPMPDPAKLEDIRETFLNPPLAPVIEEPEAATAEEVASTNRAV